VRRPSVHVLTVIAAATVGLLLVFASVSAAAPRPIGPPTTSWSVSRIVQGAGAEGLGHNTTRGRDFSQRFDLGHQGFGFPRPHHSENADPQVEWDSVGRNVLARAPSLDLFHPLGSPNGSVSHLKAVQVFEKDARSPSLVITLDQVLLEMVDANGPLTAS